MGLLAFYDGNKSQVYFISCAWHMFPYICSMRVIDFIAKISLSHIWTLNNHFDKSTRKLHVQTNFRLILFCWNVKFLKCVEMLWNLFCFFFAFETNKFTLNDLKCIFYHLMIVIFSSFPFPYRFNYIESLVKKNSSSNNNQQQQIYRSSAMGIHENRNFKYRMNLSTIPFIRCLLKRPFDSLTKIATQKKIQHKMNRPTPIYIYFAISYAWNSLFLFAFC